VPVLLATAPLSSAQYAAPTTPTAASPTYTPSVAYALDQWRRLRQSSGYDFRDYASFLIANPDWPDASRMHRWAEKAMRPGENAATVIAFFAREKPQTGNGWARLADAYAGSGRAADALAAARSAWASSDLGSDDEQALWARYGGSFTRADHDRRVDSLLFDKKEDAAARFLASASPERQAAFAARIAMQNGASDAESRYRAVIGSVTTDAGLMMDRARYLRDHNYNNSAQDLAARTHHFTYKPADTERFYEMLLLIAQDAANDRDWTTVYNITRQIDDVLPAGAEVADQPLGVRDEYTNLAWLGGEVALQRMRDPKAAMAMFDRYARAGRSLQVQTKGDYWAGRAALASGQFQTASTYFQRAAAHPGLFYGQLALERLGRAVPAPPRRAAAIYDDVGAARSVRQPASGPGPAPSRPAGPFHRAGTVRPSAGDLARHRRRPQPRAPARRTNPPAGSSGVGRADGAHQGLELLRPASLSVSVRLGLQQHLVPRQRHQPPGELVRPLRNQSRRRARDDAADAGNGPRAGWQNGSRL
jgi:soluble lytic murein transglycosylase